MGSLRLAEHKSLPISVNGSLPGVSRSKLAYATLVAVGELLTDEATNETVPTLKLSHKKVASAGESAGPVGYGNSRCPRWRQGRI